MTKNKRLLTLIICGALTLPSIANSTVFADSVTTVTIGESLNEKQKAQILNYFGVEENEVDIRIVTNKDERKYLEGIVPDEQIGHKTFSCAYIQPTQKGSGINVKTANLNYVTPQMIKSAIISLDPPQKDMDIVGASVIPVSGTGFLVGVIATLEAEGLEIDEDKKIIANEELQITGELGDEIGKDKATGIINDIKTEIIKNNTQDTIQIAETINNVTNNYNIQLTNQQAEDIQALMEKISKEDYDYNELKSSLKDVKKSINKSLKSLGEKVNNINLLEKIETWISDATQWFKDLFNKSENSIIENTNDTVLGDNAIISTTDDITSHDTLTTTKDVRNIFEKIWDWFIGLFNKSENDAVEAPVENTDNLENENIDTNEEVDNSIENQINTEPTIEVDDFIPTEEESINTEEVDNSIEETTNSSGQDTEAYSEEINVEDTLY